jgi:LPS-assembly protein
LPSNRKKRLTRIAFALAPLFMGVVHLPARAQQPSAPPNQAELDEAIRESLKLEKNIPTPGTLFTRKKGGPRILKADLLEGINQKSTRADGNVSLREGNMLITADRVDYDEETDTATIPGRVHMDRDGDIVDGRDLNMTLETRLGHLDEPTFFFSRNPTRPTQRYEARGAAKFMDFEGEDRERLYRANYTTCKPGNTDWQLNISELALDRGTNVGTGFNGVVDFMGVPILYMPYMTFPLNNERKSGMLAPSFGSSSKSGLELALPYYLNIAPNQDATLTPKIFTRRGLQLGGEYRYLYASAFGQVDTEYMDHDRVTAGEKRYLVSWRHFHNLGKWLTPGWSASVNAQKVSDDNYFRDLSTRIANTAQTNLPRDVALNYGSDFGYLSTRVLSYQTLQDPLAPVGQPYRLAPQVSFNARPRRWNGWELNTLGEFTDFEHPTLVTGRRWLLYPSAAYPITRPYGFITPKLGYHLTHYSLTGNQGASEGGNRSLPIVSLDNGLTFERVLNLGGGAITQTLEPRLFLLYVPYRDQSKLPNFSTSETDFSFAQIFNENLFVGGDRIADARQATMAVTTRFIENLTGIERLRAAIGQRYYFKPQRTVVSSDASGVSGSGTGNLSRSDLLLAVSGQVSDPWSLDSSFQYSTSQKYFQRANLAGRYNSEGRILNLSYRYTREALKQVDISTQWPFGRAAPNWTLLARANHSLSDHRLLEGLLGVEYNAGCWEFRLVAHRFATATQQYSNSIQFQLELKGLSKLGINPFETLKQNITGYRRSDDRSSGIAP